MPIAGARTWIAMSYATRCNGPCFCCHPFGVQASPRSEEEAAALSIITNVEEFEMALPRRNVPANQAMKPLHEWSDPEFAREYPSLRSFLMDVRYEDGTVRNPGTMSVFVKADALTFAINDNDRNLVAFVNQPTWEEALFVIEDGILNDSLDWKARRTDLAAKKPPY